MLRSLVGSEMCIRDRCITDYSANHYLIGDGSHFACVLFVDPFITMEDIDGAEHIEQTPNGWVFHHAMPGEHQDHEVQLVSAVESYLRLLLVQYESDSKAARTSMAKFRADRLYGLAATFYGEGIAEARKVARSHARSERHRPVFTGGNLSAEALEAIATVRSRWQISRPPNLSLIHI